MTIQGLGRVFPTGLRARIFVLMLAALIAVAVPASAAFIWVVNSTVVKIGTLFAEKQILFDRYRGLESLMREVSLAETVARSPAILEWAEDEGSAEKAARGIAELEHYRLSFKDQSYFLVLDGTGNYYFNDQANTYSGDQKRYTLNPANPRDGWYYKTKALGEGCHLNVDHDDNLSVTKVWTNCIIQRGGHILGIIGTGIDLSHFIREVVDIPQTGVQSMFVDRTGAVQAHRDRDLVDFHSLTKDVKAKKTIFRLLDNEDDRLAFAEMMTEVTAGGVLVRSRFMTINGHKYLVGIGYLDRLGWYNVTLMDIDKIVDRTMFVPIGILLATILIAVALLTTLLFKRSVLDRLARVEANINAVQSGEITTPAPDQGADEIGRLSRTFTSMAQAVGQHTSSLEHAVRERTEKLERLAYLDPLTEIANRRGFSETFAQEAGGSTGGSGLLLVDVDQFKRINDTFGHQAGDQVIVEVAKRIAGSLRKGDLLARWGGDEFIVLVKDCDPQSLAAMAGRIIQQTCVHPMQLSEEQTLDLSISIGGCMVLSDDLVSHAAAADEELYAVKHSGGARFAIRDANSGRIPLQLVI